MLSNGDDHDWAHYGTPEFDRAVDRYRDKFNTLPDLRSSRGRWLEVIEMLEEAVALDRVWSDDEWASRLDIEPLPDGAVS